MARFSSKHEIKRFGCLDQGYEGNIDTRKIIEGGIRLLNLKNYVLYFGSEQTALATQSLLQEIIFLDNLEAKK